jgi:hypothetical protein
MNLTIWAISWVDTFCENGWVHLSRVDHCTSHIVSVGFIVYEDDDTLTLTDCWSEDSGNVHGPLSIPKVAITRRVRVAEMEKVPPSKGKGRKRAKR